MVNYAIGLSPSKLDLRVGKLGVEETATCKENQAKLCDVNAMTIEHISSSLRIQSEINIVKTHVTQPFSA